MGLFGRLVRRILTKAGLAVIPAEVKVQIKLDPGAQMPTQPYPADACWDIYALEDVWVRPGIATLIPTGIYMDIPEGYEGEFKCRSSLGKQGLCLHHGTIDAGYRGEVSPFMFNWTPARFEVSKGDRVAQFCLRRKWPIRWLQVATLPPSKRGTAGHGSSGK